MSKLKTSTYGIEKDENGNPALYMNAAVKKNTVELDWVHEEDDAETYAQRGRARIEKILNAETSLPPETALLTLRLYRRGDVMVSHIACADDFREEAARLAAEAALALYDSVYPDVAQAAEAFITESIENVNRVASLDLRPVLEAGIREQVAADQFLPRLLDETKKHLAETGKVVQQIGWLVHGAMALFPIGMPPFEKYRFFRAVSEVARRVNAEAVLYVSDGYQLDPGGERTGAETLMVSWINPDGTCASAGVTYRRRKHSLLDHDIIKFTLDIDAHKSEQNTLAEAETRTVRTMHKNEKPQPYSFPANSGRIPDSPVCGRTS